MDIGGKLPTVRFHQSLNEPDCMTVGQILETEGWVFGTTRLGGWSEDFIRPTGVTPPAMPLNRHERLLD